MARLDTGWHNNPKVLRLSDKGMALHAWSISYCDAARSDGFIAQDAWPARFGRAVKELERASMWERCEGGYYLHDYLDYNRSRAYIDDYARAKRKAGRAGGQASASARASPDGQAKRQQTLNQMLNEHLKQNPTPGPGVNESLLPGGRLVGPGVARAREASLPEQEHLAGLHDGTSFPWCPACQFHESDQPALQPA